MDDLGKIIALTISILTVRQMWLTSRKTKLEIEKLELEKRRKRRGG